MKNSIKFLGAFVVIAVSIWAGGTAFAQKPPPLPHAFYGIVTIGTGPAPEDTVISAEIEGVTGSFTTTVDAQGKYGYSPTFKIPADDPDTSPIEGGVDGAKVIFKVNGVPIEKYMLWVEDVPQEVDTVTFVSGQASHLDLTVPAPPVVRFSATPTSGNAPLTVNFTDESTGEITSWLWTFGDGGTSTDQNPSHTYSAGTYTVSLTVTGPGGPDTETKGGYITVMAPPPAGGGGGAPAAGGGAAPAPTPTPTPTPTATPTPTPTPTPTATPTPTPTPFIEDISDRIDDEGMVLEDIEFTSADGLVRLEIGEGTTALTAEGEPLQYIEVVEAVPVPPPPAGFHIIGLTYDFRPDRATFNPHLSMTIEYDPASIPEGVDEEDIVIAYFDIDPDTGRGEWVVLDSVVDPVTRTVSAQASHTTPFGILGGTRAFKVTDLTINPGTADPGDTVTISAEVTNTGGVEGTYTVSLRIQGEVEDALAVSLSPGASQTVSFTVSREDAGTYGVDIGGLEAEFEIEEGPTAIAWWLIFTIIAGAVVVGLAVYLFTRRRKREATATS